MRDRWKVVRLSRSREPVVISKHWWFWTAQLAATMSVFYFPDDVFDVWRIR